MDIIKNFLSNLINPKMSQKDIKLKELLNKIANTNNYTELVKLCKEYNKLKAL